MESTAIEATSPNSGAGFRRFVGARYLFGAVVVSAGIAATVLAVMYFVARDGTDVAVGELLQAPVTRGDLVDSVSSDGSIVFPERSALSFGTAGTVDEILVSVGDTVVIGQELVSLDPLTRSNLSANAPPNSESPSIGMAVPAFTTPSREADPVMSYTR